jgi:catechol 2,3-dioxygenase-like lactoylglutathione lyase family enzyme
MEPGDAPANSGREQPVPAEESTADGGGQLGRLRLASAVMFVRRLDRSVPFYCELLALEVVVQTPTAALLASASGSQLYLRSMGANADHPLGGIGIQYLIWTAESEEDLSRCEQVLRAYSPSSQVSSEKTADGFTLVEGPGPDDVPIMVTYPGPDQAPRTQILQRIYRW